MEEKLAKIKNYLMTSDRFQGYDLNEMMNIAESILNDNRSYESIIDSCLEGIRCNQGSFGDGRSEAADRLKIKLVQVVKGYM